MDISEKNETKVTVCIVNQFQGIKYYQYIKCYVCCYDNSDASKWEKNLHLIQFYFANDSSDP